MAETAFDRSRRVALRWGPMLRLGRTTRTGVARAAGRSDEDGVPAVRASFRSAAELAIDEFFIAAQTAVRRTPEPAELRRQMAAVEAAAAQVVGLAPEGLYHAAEAEQVELSHRARRGRSWEVLAFSTPLDLPPLLTPLSQRGSDQPVVRAHVRLLRHAEPRPWVIVVHGAQMGRDSDLLMLRARHLYEQLGLNVALPVLPMHGPRGTSPATTVPGIDVLTNISTVLVAVAEIRALRSWIAATYENPPVGIAGVSLGGYVAALASGVERNFDVVVAAIPVVNPQELIARHLTRSATREALALAAELRSPPVLALERFVDPMAFHPLTPAEHLHVIGGLLDSVTTPGQAAALARHWGVEVQWYEGGHVGHFWSSDARTYVDDALGALDPARHKSVG
jgi:pimeloyl-ACP methyl ester carboxylesterase